MIRSHLLIFVFFISPLIHAEETATSANAANLVGGGTGVITRVIFIKMDVGESQSYLVDFRGEALVVQRNLGFPSEPLKVGDKITFEIIQNKVPAFKQPLLVFMEEPNEEFKARFKQAAAKAPPVADNR